MGSGCSARLCDADEESISSSQKDLPQPITQELKINSAGRSVCRDSLRCSVVMDSQAFLSSKLVHSHRTECRGKPYV